MTKPLSLECRNNIHRLAVSDNRDCNFIFAVLFGCDSEKISLKYIKFLINFFKTAPTDDIVSYLLGPSPKLGRPRKHDAGDDLLVQDIIDSVNTQRLWSIMKTFCRMKGINENESSISSIYRAQLRIRYSLKGLTRLHVRQNPIEAARHFELCGDIHEDNLLCFDAISTEGGDNLKESQGRSKIGTTAVKRELVIWGVSWCVVALYSTIGFLSWRYFEGTGVDNVDIQKFIWVCVAPYFCEGHVVMCDNASNNKHVNTQACLEEVTGGSYLFNKPYQHYNNPIERGFANVVNEVRQHEDDALVSTVAILEHAFDKYSCIGSHGHQGIVLHVSFSRAYNNLIIYYIILILQRADISPCMHKII
jgi:hypothetical protein